jgi:hypothetical protein
MPWQGTQYLMISHHIVMMHRTKRKYYNYYVVIRCGDARIRARKCAPENKLLYHFTNENALALSNARDTTQLPRQYVSNGGWGFRSSPGSGWGGRYTKSKYNIFCGLIGR